MKFFFFITACLLLTLFILWIIGPRSIIRRAPETIPTIPDDIDDYLQERESHTMAPIKKGLEASVMWAHTDKRKTEIALIYLHGFSSSRAEMTPVFETIAGQLGANIFFTRFQGHGSESGEMLRKVAIDDWMKDALEARAIGEKIGNRLIIAGTSHGALLASWVATVPGFRSSPEAVILTSPNFAPFDKRTQLLTKPWARQILPWIFGRHRDWDPQNSGHEYYWNTVYPTDALFPMMAQVNYITPRSPLQLTAPTLVFYSRYDTTVNPQLIVKAFEQFPSNSKKLVEIRNVGDAQQHILAGDILSPETTSDVITEIQTYLNETGVVPVVE